MELREMEVAQLEERKAQIALDVDNEGADLDALQEEVRAINQELETRKQEAEARQAVLDAALAGAGTVVEERTNETMETRTFAVDTQEYRVAYFKNLMGKELTAEERTGMDSQTTSGGYAIPTETKNKIVENLVKTAPMLNYVDVMHMAGNVSIAIEGTRNAAAIHTENASLTAAEDTLVHITLGGYELCKLISVSAKLNAMSIADFENWIVSNLSRCLGELVENYIINGTGSSQPKGIAYAETWSSGTNGVDWASTAPTVAEIETLIGLQNQAYIDNAKFLMNWKTFWNKVHTLRDDKFEPVVTRENGKYYLFGFEILFSSKVADDTMFFGDYFEGVKANFAQDVEIAADRSSGFRNNAVDYRGACLFDCTTVSGRIVKSAASF